MSSSAPGLIDFCPLSTPWIYKRGRRKPVLPRGCTQSPPGLAKLEMAMCHLVHACDHMKAFLHLPGSENIKLVRHAP